MPLTQTQDRERACKRRRSETYNEAQKGARKRRRVQQAEPPEDTSPSPSPLEDEPHAITFPVHVPENPWWLDFHTRMLRTRWPQPEWNYRCPHCSALLLRGEAKTFCCNNGNCCVPPLPPLPTHISNLINDTRASRHLSTRSWCLNNLFCFTAIGATKGFTHFETGLSSVAITGRTYHRIFDIADESHCLHWFLYDEIERKKQGHEFHVPQTWIEALKMDLQIHNPYVAHLQTFPSIEDATPAALELCDVSANGDFAAVMHAPCSTTFKPRSILVWQNNHEEPTFIPIFSRHYEPLQYPLLFPHGTPGWGLTEGPSRKLIRSMPYTQRQWYRGHLLTDERFTIFGRLTSEYLCDMYSRIEEERLDYIRRSQDRSEDANIPNQNRTNIPTSLPASFLGSRRWTSEQTADGLALARTFGPPSLFITMTCNPDWPEIKNRLRKGQKANDVPVIVARVFKVRVQRLVTILKTRFGTLIYIIKITEFQKRGLPHVHIVIKVRPRLHMPFTPN
jgi:hypothetical protein